MTIPTLSARRAGLLAAMVVAGSAAAAAQTGTPGQTTTPRSTASSRDKTTRVFDRLFAPGQSGPGTFATSVEEGRDTQTGKGREALISPIPLGTFFGVNPSATYGAEDVGFAGGGVFRRYNDTGEFKVYDAHASVSGRLTGRTSVMSVSTSVGYAPYSQMFAGGVGLDGAGPDTAALGRPVTTTTAAVSAGKQLSRRVMLSAVYDWQYRHLGPATESDQTLADTQMHNVSARLNRQLGRYSILFVGYGTRFSHESAQHAQTVGQPLRAHDINIGLDRAQDLKLSRHSTLQFSTGTSIVQTAGGNRFFAIGSATLRHEMSRTWAVDLTARRGVGYLEGIPGPTLSQSVVVTLGGALGSRFDVHGDAGYSNGDMSLYAASSGFRAFSGSARVRALLTRRLAAYGEWTFYDQLFDNRLFLPSGLDPSLTRQGLRVGVMMNVPLGSEMPRQRGER